MSFRLHRPRRRVLALSGCAAAIAGVIATAPMVSGAHTIPAKASYLTRVESGGVDHNAAHRAATPAAKRRARARRRLCAPNVRWRASPAARCPTPAPTTSQAFEARVAGGKVSPLGSTQPDGLWGPLLSIPSTAIHAIVLPTNKVLYLSQPKGVPGEYEEVDGGNAYVWDPATNTSRSVPPPDVPYPSGADRPANLWCAGQTTLADGRVLVVGGNLRYPANGGIGAGNGFRGGKWVMTFDPWTETWTRYADMPHGRWYPTLTELPDGKVLIVGGWDETGGVQGPGGAGDPPAMANDQDVEVFDPATPAGGVATTVVSHLPPNDAGPPHRYPDHQGIALYPHMFVLPDTTTAGAGGDKVLVAGPNRYDSAIIDTSTWVWTDVVHLPDTGQPRLSSDRSWGTAWLEPSGPSGSTRVVLLGGSDASTPVPGVPGSTPAPLRTAEVLDLDDPGAGWEPDPALDLNLGRAHFNTVLLPDGSILANGGGYGRKNDTLYAEPVYRSELYTQASGWREVGEEADARTYHSTSVLLPDGRVASAGDDRDIASAISPEHLSLAYRTAQLWSPPYLFNGPQPAVTFAPGSVRYDAPFRVAISGSPAAVTRAVLIRPGAVTHSVDMAQRAIPLDLSAEADGLTLHTPRNATVAPPGYYMLFVLNADGVPSVASWVKLDPNAPDAPPLPPPPPPPPNLPTPPTPAQSQAPEPAPAPAGTPIVPHLTLIVRKPLVHRVGSRVRVALRLRANLRSTARVTLIHTSNGRAITTRSLLLAPRTTLTRTITIGSATLAGQPSVRVRVVAQDALGGRLAINRIAEVPARR